MKIKRLILTLFITLLMVTTGCTTTQSNYGGVLFSVPPSSGIDIGSPPSAFTGYWGLSGPDVLTVQQSFLPRKIMALSADTLRAANIQPDELPLVMGDIVNLYATEYRDGHILSVLPYLYLNFYRDGLRIYVKPIEKNDLQLFSGLTYSASDMINALKLGAKDFGTSVRLSVTFVDTLDQSNVVITPSRTVFDDDEWLRKVHAVGVARNSKGESASNQKIGQYVGNVEGDIGIRINEAKEVISSPYAFLPQSAIDAYMLYLYRNVIRHELTHFLGMRGGFVGAMGHSANPRSIMYATTGSNYVEIRSVSLTTTPRTNEFILVDDPMTKLRFVAKQNSVPTDEEPTAKVFRAIGAVLSQ